MLIVAGLTPPEHEVELVDEAISRVNPDVVEADLVGITANTCAAPRAYEVADAFRSRGIPVVMGGIHPTVLPEEAIQHCDSVVIGEAEGLWHKVLEDARQGTLKKFYRNDSFPRLEGCPWPRRQLLRKDSYIITNTVQTTRGCPFDCSFCSVTQFFGATYRTRPVEDVVQEVSELPGKIVIFVDDNIMGNPRYAKGLFESLVGLRKKWLSQGSLTMLRDQSLLKLAARSGCRGLLIGFETLSTASLKKIGKAFNVVEKYKEAIDRLHQVGIGVIGSFIFGMDDDDEGVFERTVEFVEKTKMDIPTFAVLTPLPGTKLYKKLEEENRIFDRDWAKYDGAHVVFKPMLMSPEKLQEGYHWAMKQAYSVRGILRRMFGFNSRLPVFGPLNLIYMRQVRAYLARCES